MPLFTIFIPTYNRGYCVDKAVLSCEKLTFRDFEVIVVDDGSSDDTKDVIAGLKDSVTFELRYLFQENQGKHIAFNFAVSQANGELFITLDSDDTILPSALEELQALWAQVPQNDEFASMEFRCLEAGEPSSSYPEPYLDSDYLSRRLIVKSLGEKRSIYRVSVLKDFPYPQYPGERYCRPGLIDIRIARKYKTRFCNIVAIDAGHFPDGIGANRRKIIASAPNAYRQYFLEEITNNVEFCTKKDLKSFYKRYTRCSFNAGVGITQMLSEVPDKWRLVRCIPECFLGSIKDRVVYRK